MRVIKNALTFTNVAAGASATLAHGLSIHAHNVRPDEIKLNYPGFTATATDTSVTVTNNNLLPATCTALCEYWHTLERDMRPDPLTAATFVASTGYGTTAAAHLAYRTAVATPVTVGLSDDIIGVDVGTISGPVVVNLPSAVTAGAGRMFWFKDWSGDCSGTNTITITPTGGQTVDEDPNYVMDLPFEDVAVFSDGANWFVSQ